MHLDESQLIQFFGESSFLPERHPLMFDYIIKVLNNTWLDYNGTITRIWTYEKFEEWELKWAWISQDDKEWALMLSWEDKT